jgi:Flp pilus assembly protein TadG
MTFVEAAMVLPLCVMVPFLVIEGCRVMIAQGLLDHAVRDGARLASVSTLTLQTSDIVGDVMTRLKGNQGDLEVTVQVYKTDPVTGNSLGDWTDAGRGDFVAVEATSTHHTLIPTFGIFSKTMTLRSKSIRPSEGN